MTPSLETKANLEQAGIAGGRRRRRYRRGTQTGAVHACATERASPSWPIRSSCRRPIGRESAAPAAPRCAPTRVYEQIEHDQPGTPARIHTYPHRDDLAAMEADIRAAKDAGRRGARLASLGHPFRARADRRLPARRRPRGDRRRGRRDDRRTSRPFLKGCEVIDGKPVFYSLCNFATDLRMDQAHAKSKSLNEIRVLAEEWEPDFEGLYNFPTAIAPVHGRPAEIADGKVVRAGFLPLHIGRDAIPRFAPPGSERVSTGRRLPDRRHRGGGAQRPLPRIRRHGRAGGTGVKAHLEAAAGIVGRALSAALSAQCDHHPAGDHHDASGPGPAADRAGDPARVADRVAGADLSVHLAVGLAPRCPRDRSGGMRVPVSDCATPRCRAWAPR